MCGWMCEWTDGWVFRSLESPSSELVLDEGMTIIQSCILSFPTGSNGSRLDKGGRRGWPGQ